MSQNEKSRVLSMDPRLAFRLLRAIKNRDRMLLQMNDKQVFIPEDTRITIYDISPLIAVEVLSEIIKLEDMLKEIRENFGKL